MLLVPVCMVLPIKQLPLDNRPRERLATLGPASLTEPELISLLFGGDLPAAEGLVERLGTIAGLRVASLAQLHEVPGVGPARAAQLLAAVELGRRAAGPWARSSHPSLRNPEEACMHLCDMRDLEQEELRVVSLDARHRPLSRFTSALGAANVVHVSPRDVFRRALREGAVAVLVAHNHPSGDPTPSGEDLALTRRLRAAGEVVGVALLDHLIIATEGCYSFEERRVIREPTRRQGG